MAGRKGAKNGKEVKEKNGKTKNGNGPLAGVKDYRYEATKRKNIPPAKIAAEGVVPLLPKTEYFYSARRPPKLQFDPTGKPDQLPELLATARKRALNEDEVKALAEALRDQEPWLEWAGKREARKFEVDPVVLHIHERISAKAILKVAARQDVERSLFADPEQAYHEAVQFYRHDIDWTNRLILGDSLQVMSSLARREDLAGKVQMIYIDPPYGIKFASNFQPEIRKRDVKEQEQDLTREPEMVKAYRDTWHLGIRSYLTYLRDRLIVAKALLSDAGSIFVQIGEENRHRVRMLLEEVMGPENFICEINYRTSIGLGGSFLDPVANYLIWFAKDKGLAEGKYHQIYRQLVRGEEGATRYTSAESRISGEVRLLDDDEDEGHESLSEEWRPFTDQGLTSRSGSATTTFPVSFRGSTYKPTVGGWRTGKEGMRRVLGAERVLQAGSTIRFKKCFEDFGWLAFTNFWDDVGGGVQSRQDPKRYVVQTATSIIERCLLMTTNPGDLVLDPTCGGGTTAYVAEKWGRRWVTIDTSRVSIAIARQRLLTSKFDFYRLRPLTADDQARNPNGTWLTSLECGGSPPLSSGQVAGPRREQARDTPSEAQSGSELPHSKPVTFKCKTVPHVTLKSIAQNTNLDPIFAKHEPILEEWLAACNAALARVPEATRRSLAVKLMEKQKAEGRKAITDADRRRWELPPRGGKWQHWQVPFDTDPDYPKELADAVMEYRKAWRAKMDEVNACIASNGEQEELVDLPEVVKGVLRVSGPFTVEAVQPPEMMLGDVEIISGSGVRQLAAAVPPGSLLAEPESGSELPQSKEGRFAGEPEELELTFAVREVESRIDLEAKNVDAYLEQMIRLLRMDGVRFPDNKQMHFTRLEPLRTVEPGLQAEGRWVPGENGGRAPEKRQQAAAVQTDSDPEGKATVCVAYGPQYGPVTAKMVEDVIRSANRMGYDDLVIAGFSFDGPAQAVIEEAQRPRLRIHAAHIRPDVNPGMNGLLKEQPGSQLFTVFGQPRTRADGPDREGQYTVTMEGVDIYNPVDNSITSTGANKVAAWFLDGDYDGRTFCITQAFFPDRTAWTKLSKALENVVDPERFEALSGTVSLPFPAGKHKCVAVKVIDPRGNEVMQVHKL
jgi:adenine-specific DNA-methyltransferase